MSICPPVMPVIGSIEVGVSRLVITGVSRPACMPRLLSAHHSGKSHEPVARFRGDAGVSMPVRVQQNRACR
jgi:hypothetical protein